MRSYEHEFPGGIYFEGDEADPTRTDVSLEVSPCKPRTIDIRFVSGAGTFCLAGCLIKDVKALAKWMAGVAEDEQQREREETL